MPGYILHLTEAKLICQELEKKNIVLDADWKRRFALGCLLPDTRAKSRKVSSHFWNPAELGHLAMAPDMDLFLGKYRNRLESPLMLGYWTHLMLDAWYVKEFWPQILEFLRADGSVGILREEISSVRLKQTGQEVPREDFFTSEYYYGDYTRMNLPLMERYHLTIPEYESNLICPVEEVCPEDLQWVLEELALIMEKSRTAVEEPLRVFPLEALEEFVERCAGKMTGQILQELMKHSGRRMFALDLDGTLLRSDKELSPRNLQLLEERIALGDVVIAASGRPYSALPRNITGIEGLQYAITSNGVSVYEVKDARRICHCPMPEAQARQVLDYVRQRNLSMEILIDGQAYAEEDLVAHPQKYGLDDHGVIYIQNTRIPVRNLMGFAEEHCACLDGINLRTSGSEAKRQYWDELSRIPGIFLTSSTPRLLEIAGAGAGKEHALEWLADYLKIDPAMVYAFGNEENDMDMMRSAGHGVAVGNSPEHVKAAADYVTASNDEDGVALFLEQITGAVRIPGRS